MSERKKKIIVNSPAGVAVYPKLNKPDTKFNPAGDYSCKLRLSASDESHAAFLAELTSMAQAQFDAAQADLKEKRNFKAAKEMKLAVPYTEELDEEGNATDAVIVNFKMKAQFSSKEGETFTQKPKIFDAKGVEITKPPMIWSGSVLKINAEVVPFYTATAGAGISLRLRAVKLLKLVSGGNGDAKSFGFGDDEAGEDGYTFDASSVEVGSAASDDDDSGDF